MIFHGCWCSVGAWTIYQKSGMLHNNWLKIMYFKNWIRYLCLEPYARSIRAIAQSKISSIHQALTSLVEPQSWAHSVHDIAKRQPSARIGKAKRTTKAGVPKSLF